jgi:hypothetical protein
MDIGRGNVHAGYGVMTITTDIRNRSLPQPTRCLRAPFGALMLGERLVDRK